MKIWIWPVSEKNWSTVKAKKVWATKTNVSAQKGDKIVFYVTKSKYFQGVYIIASDWGPAVTQWPDTNSSELTGEVRVKEVQLGFADVDKFLQKLNAPDGDRSQYSILRGHLRGTANYGKDIPEKIYQLILDDLKKIQHR